MGIQAKVIASIVVLLSTICLAMLLRRVGLVKEEDGALLSRLVTHVTLPALIFVSLMGATLRINSLLLRRKGKVSRYSAIVMIGVDGSIP
jgi:predicted permease